MVNLCEICGEMADHYVPSVGHLSDLEDAITPYYTCRPKMSAYEARAEQ